MCNNTWKENELFDLKYSLHVNFMNCFTGRSSDCNVSIRKSNISEIKITGTEYLSKQEKEYMKFMFNKLKKYVDEL